MLSEPIREGFFYRNRKGEAIGPMERHFRTEFYYVQNDSRSYDKFGRFRFGGEHGDSFDLIAPWPDAPAPQPAEQVPSVDIVRHEREELRKANAELLERFKDAEHERDQLRTQLAQWQGASKELDEIVMEEISEREASHDLLDDIASAILCEEVNWTFHNLKWREALGVAKSMRFERSKLLAELSESRNELATAKADAMKLINSNSLSIYDYNELVKRYF
jgi:hypothetical protein